MYSWLPSFKSTFLMYLACFLLGFVCMTQVAILLESFVKFVIITGPQRIVIASGLSQIVMSICSGVYSVALKNFLMESTPEGTYKINVSIMLAFFLTFMLAVFLQTSFDNRISEIIGVAKEPSLLPASVSRDEIETNPFVASLSVQTK